ncbi:MAG: histidine kinase, partial [Muribaculaceae bacterium]|nr:histidine kinase [Muribaculaceae bacterium]
YEEKHRLDLIVSTFYAIAFILNYLWLVPRFLLRSSRVTLYFVVNFLMIVAVMCFIPVYVQANGGWGTPPDKEDMSLLRNALVYAGFSVRDGIMMVLTAGLAYALRIGREKDVLHQRELELRAEQRQIELRNLKAQLNPHFLFNSLNNIYALIGISPERAQEALHDLSSMLRFVIYDAAEATVSLDKVTHFIGEYVDMMRLRVSGKCRLEYRVDAGIPKGIMIEPLLFMTLVENAFKHSLPNGKDHYISISLSMSENKIHSGSGNGKALLFEVSNSVSDKRQERLVEERPGVGLANIRRQLNLLYPGTHSLSISGSEEDFRASIRISLSALKREGDPNPKGNGDDKAKKETGGTVCNRRKTFLE